MDNKENLLKLLDEIDIKSKILDILNPKIDEIKFKIENLEKSLSVEKEKNSELEEELSELTQEKTSLESDNDNLNRDIIELEKENNRYAEKIDKLYSKIENLEKSLSVEKEKNSELEEELSELSQEKTRLESDNDNLNKDIIELEKENNRYEKKINNLKEELSNEKIINDNLREELEDINLDKTQLEEEKEILIFKLKELEDKFTSMHNIVKDSLKIYKLFNFIDEDLKEELEEIFKGRTFEEFLACGVQSKNLELLWEIAKKSILENSVDFHKIIDIFYFFFDLINKTYDKPMYKFLNVEIDQPFNPFLQLSYGSASGTIKEVLLNGYEDRNGKVIKKAVVRI